VACVDRRGNRGLLSRWSRDPPHQAHLRLVLAPAAIQPGHAARAGKRGGLAAHCPGFTPACSRSEFFYDGPAADPMSCAPRTHNSGSLQRSKRTHQPVPAPSRCGLSVVKPLGPTRSEARPLALDGQFAGLRRALIALYQSERQGPFPPSGQPALAGKAGFEPRPERLGHITLALKKRNPAQADQPRPPGALSRCRGVGGPFRRKSLRCGELAVLVDCLSHFLI